MRGVARGARRRAAALALVLLSACGGEPPPKNIVMVVLDTVRADHLSCYGYARPTTPHIDAFSSRADRYAVARSTAPWTLPSHASLFTGKSAHLHGADAMRLPSGEIVDAVPLAADELTLAEVLRDGGYATGAFVANHVYVNPRMGLSKGFDEFMNERHDARGMSARAARWVARQTPERPWFLFVNYMDAHRPYNTRALPAERAAELPAPPRPGEPNAVAALDALYEHVFLREEPPPPEMVQRVVEYYDLALANLDLGLGVLLDDLRRRGLLDDALVVITSDHGEYFGEHDLVEHSKDVYEPALRIPLIVKRPGQSEGRVIEAPISIADVPGLVLREAAPEVAKRHADGFQGSTGGPGQMAQAKYARKKDLQREWRERFLRERDALYVDDHKLIRSSDGHHELYDLARDPQELENLFEKHPAEATKLMASLERELRNAKSRAPATLPALSTEEIRAMKALGYIEDDSDAEDAAPADPGPPSGK